MLSQVRALSIYKSEKDVVRTTQIIEEIIKRERFDFFSRRFPTIRSQRKGELRYPQCERFFFEDGDLTTSLIECQPTTALDLPLKILVWEEHGDVYLAYIDPQFMKKRFMLQGCEEIIDDMGKLLARLTIDATRAIQSED